MTSLAMILQQLISSSTHLVVKSITTAIHPSSVVLWRGVLACLVYALWCVFRRRHLRAVDRRDWMPLLLLGVLNMPVNQMLFIWGTKYTIPANAAFAYALTPTFVVIFQRLVYGDKPSPMRWLGVAVAFAGTAVVLVDKGASVTGEYMLGNLMVLGASASWAMFTMLARPLVLKYGGAYVTGLSFFAGMLTFLPVWFVVAYAFPTSAAQDSAALFQAGSASFWMQLVYLGVVTSGLGYGLWLYALAKMDSARVAVFNNLQPILTTLMAMVVYKHLPTPYFLVGGVLALVGVVITQRSR